MLAGGCSGAWQWPAFAVLTAADAVVIARLPFQGAGPDAVGAALLAGFVNLLAVAVAAPLLGALLRRRRGDLPKVVARDYAGTALLSAITAALLAGGLAHRSSVVAERAEEQAVHAAVHDYVVAGEPAFRAGLGAVDTVRLEPEHYRACVYAAEELPLCFFVNTDQSPAGLERDTSREPNGRFGR